MKRILVAGMGNVLRRDDGFGVQVANQLTRENDMPPNVQVIEVGIGGIHLVQELMAGYDVLVVIDAVARGSAPGTMHVLQVQVPDLATWGDDQRGDFLADMHYTTPSKALILARAMGVLPPIVYLVGCQPADANELGIGLSEPVAQATAKTLREIGKIVRHFAEPHEVALETSAHGKASFK
ncbi:MAG: hydrogenase maturation protease [Chloroflexi bacterium]|nr:hydrogenase maturation protease [Chloroflexota bacterium]